MFDKCLKSCAIAIMAAVVTVTSVPAASASDDAIQNRKTLMKGVGAAMGGLKMVVQGKAPAAVAGPIAGTMVSFANLTGSAFPKGSGGANTRAKDEVWSKPAEFKAAVMAFQKAAAGVAAAAKGGGDIKAAFGMLGKSCGGCHKPFRKPKS